MAKRYIHSADLTCLAEAIGFDARHRQLQEYLYPFRAESPNHLKDAVRGAIGQAMSSRGKAKINHGRMFVELNDDDPLSGRVRDVVAKQQDVVNAAPDDEPQPTETTPPVENEPIRRDKTPDQKASHDDKARQLVADMQDKMTPAADKK